MYAVIFEVEINKNRQDEYLAIAAKLKEQLVTMKGFISIERFTSLVNEEDILSWKKNIDHMSAQEKGRESIFKDYRIRIANVERDYTMKTSTLTKK